VQQQVLVAKQLVQQVQVLVLQRQQVQVQVLVQVAQLFVVL
jgi:hypothetical protein